MELTVENGKGYVAGVAEPAGGRADRPDPGRCRSSARCARSPTRSRTPASARSPTTTSCPWTVETNGAVTPEDAVALAARILQDQLQLFINFEEPDAAVEAGDRRRAAVQPEPAAQGRRAGAVGALGQLPEERQHRLYRRSGAEDRGGDAAHAELRPQVAERDQGSAGARWACTSAWRSRTGRRRTSRSWPSGSKSRIETERRSEQPIVEEDAVMRHRMSGRKLNRTSAATARRCSPTWRPR